MNKKEKIAVGASIVSIAIVTSLLIGQAGFFALMVADEIDQEQALSDTLFPVGGASSAKVAQSFIPQCLTQTRASIFLNKIGWTGARLTNIYDFQVKTGGEYNGNVIVSIRNTLNGNDLTSASKLIGSIPSDTSWVEFDYPDLSVVPGNTYYLVVRIEGESGDGWMGWMGIHSNPYTGGSSWSYDNDNPDWTEDIFYDLAFRTYGTGHNERPVADANGPYSGNVNEQIRFDASASYDPDGAITQYDWKWTTTGEWNNNIGATPTHIYNTEGEYVVSLRVYDNYDSTDADTTIVTISGYDYPQVKTLNATNVGSSSATLLGHLNDMGGADSCEVWFVYDVESHDSWSQYLLDTDPITRISTGLFEVEIDGLSSGTEYHFRAIASNDAGTVQGDDEVFETSLFPFMWIGIGSIAVVGVAGFWWKRKK